MKNKNKISGAVIEAVSVRKGPHSYEDKEVIEITFKGFNCDYVQVLDLKAARALDILLRDSLPPLYEEL